MNLILGAIVWIVFGGIALVSFGFLIFLISQLAGCFHWTPEQRAANFAGIVAGFVLYKTLRNRRK